MLDIRDAERQTDIPYPLIIKRDFLPEDLFQRLKAEFPTDEEAKAFSKVMGGRQRLGSEDKAFYTLIETKPAWKELYDIVNSEAFVAQIFEIFDAEIRDWAAKPGKPWTFDPELMRRTARHYPISLPERIGRKLGLVKPLVDPVPPPAEQDRLYVHFDISASYDGYEREVHHDSSPRIAGFIIYFTNAEETGGTGGEFGVHRLKPGKTLVEHPDEADTEVVRLLRAEANMFVMFLSTPNSYHSVPRIAGAQAARQFIYAGISSERRYWDDGRKA